MSSSFHAQKIAIMVLGSFQMMKEHFWVSSFFNVPIMHSKDILIASVSHISKRSKYPYPNGACNLRKAS